MHYNYFYYINNIYFYFVAKNKNIVITTYFSIKYMLLVSHEMLIRIRTSDKDSKIFYFMQLVATPYIDYFFMLYLLYLLYK